MVSIKGYENVYSVTKEGKVWSHNKGKFLKPQKAGKQGYDVVTLWRNNTKKHMYVHRLVAQAYIPNPHNLKTVNHIDEIRDNNKVTNLEWMSLCDNIEYSLAKTYHFSYNGKKVKVFNLSKFCRENGLNAPHMSGVHNGKRNSHKGYKKIGGE